MSYFTGKSGHIGVAGPPGAKGDQGIQGYPGNKGEPGMHFPVSIFTIFQADNSSGLFVVHAICNSWMGLTLCRTKAWVLGKILFVFV